jgi:hypothetical protein
MVIIKFANIVPLPFAVSLEEHVEKSQQSYILEWYREGSSEMSSRRMGTLVTELIIQSAWEKADLIVALHFILVKLRNGFQYSAWPAHCFLKILFELNSCKSKYVPSMVGNARNYKCTYLCFANHSLC